MHIQYIINISCIFMHNLHIINIQEMTSVRSCLLREVPSMIIMITCIIHNSQSYTCQRHIHNVRIDVYLYLISSAPRGAEYDYNDYMHNT